MLVGRHNNIMGRWLQFRVVLLCHLKLQLFNAGVDFKKSLVYSHCQWCSHIHPDDVFHFISKSNKPIQNVSLLKLKS